MDTLVVSDEDFDLDSLYNTAVLDAVPAGVLICDSEGRIIRGNNELHRLFGYSNNSLTGKTISLLLPDEKQDAHHNHIASYFSNPSKRSMGAGKKLMGKRADGSTFPLEIGLNPVNTPYGIQVIATVSDTSARQLVENNFEKIFETAPIGILIVDSNGIIQHCNNLITSIFGFSIEEIKEQSLEILLPERHRTKHIQHRTTYTANPTSRAMGSERDLTGLHKNGTEFPIEIGLNPVEGENSSYIIATVTDITQRKKAELKLKQLNADLDEFTYVASHDLKSPLRGIASLIEWIEEDIGSNMTDNIRKNIDRALLRIHRMEKLVEDLLSYARSGQQQTESMEIELGDLIDNVLQITSPPESFKVTTNGYLGKIYSYHTPLETVLRNLVSNAIKHHDKESGSINIKVSIQGSFFIFEIEDDGPGIAKSAHERIFKLFQTLSIDDDTRSGVGLAVSKRLIESHGGKIEVHSKDGCRCTCFKFWWPRFSRRDINE